MFDLNTHKGFENFSKISVKFYCESNMKYIAAVIDTLKLGRSAKEHNSNNLKTFNVKFI